MKSMRYAVLVSLLFVSGCIVGDQLTTLTVHPDGSADLVVFRSNLHSTEKGEKGAKEIAKYKADFEKRVGDDFARIVEAGGKITSASWVRDQAPFSNVVHAHFAGPDVLEKYGLVNSPNEIVQVTTKFHRDGAQRSLTVHITMSPDKLDVIRPAQQDAKKLRQRYASGISETRIAVIGGSITSARGFEVARDDQSALLSSAEITEGLLSGKGNAEFYLKWDVTP